MSNCSELCCRLFRHSDLVIPSDLVIRHFAFENHGSWRGPTLILNRTIPAQLFRCTVRPAGEGNETHRQDASGFHFAIAVFFHHDQALGRVDWADRNDHTSPGPKLFQQWRRDVIGGRGDDDGVEGRLVLPAEITVAVPHASSAVATPVLFVVVSAGHCRSALAGMCSAGAVVSRTVIV